MRAFIIGDLHVNPFGEYSPVEKNFVSNRSRLFYNTIDWVIELIEQQHAEHPLDLIVFLGDLFDENGYINPVAKYHVDHKIPPMINRVCNDLQIPMRILIGNHELYDIAQSVSIIEHFNYYSPICKVINLPSIESIAGSSIAFIPYIGKNYHDSVINMINANQFEFMFSHLDFKGAGLNPKIKSVGGIELDRLKRSQGGVLTIFDGHYHHPGIRIIKNDEFLLHLHCVGAMYHLDHTDVYEDDPNLQRGPILVDTDKVDATSLWNSRRFINPYTDYYVTVRKESVEELTQSIYAIPHKSKTHLKIFTSTILTKEDVSKITGGEFLTVKVFTVYKSVKSIIPKIGRSVDVLNDVDAVNIYIDQLNPILDRQKLTNICLEEILGLTNKSRSNA